MQFRLLISACLALALLPSGAEEVVTPAPPPPDFAPPPQAWMGLHVVKPDRTTTVHLPSLPPGVGFVVDRVDEDGPAARAGLQKYDVLWKYRDQMLVNEAQLATLLSHAKPGEEVTLSAFRKGEPVTVELVLGEAPVKRREQLTNAVETVILPHDNSPMRVINMATRQASYSTDDGRAVVRREGEDYRVTIHGADGDLIYEGVFGENSDYKDLPRDWRRRVCALRRGLDHALSDRTMTVRPPRPRVVPAASPGS